MTAASQRRTAFIWLFIGVVSGLMIAAPFALEIDMSSGGGALVFVGAIGIVVSLLVTGLYFNRASTLRKMMSKENLLAEWNEQGGGKTLISRDGVLTDKILYTFKDVACELKAVTIRASEPSNKLIFSIDVPSRHGSQVTTVEVPIPQDQDERAKEVVAALRQQYLR